jgi:hypothetical protein
VVYYCSALYTTDAPQLRVLLEPFQQGPGEAETIDGFGHEGTGDGQAVFRRAADPTPAGGNKADQRDYFQDGNQAAGGIIQFPRRFFQGREELALQDVRELQDGFTRSKLHKGLAR